MQMKIDLAKRRLLLMVGVNGVLHKLDVRFKALMVIAVRHT